jgi:hypothetical protein
MTPFHAVKRHFKVALVFAFGRISMTLAGKKIESSERGWHWSCVFRQTPSQWRHNTGQSDVDALASRAKRLPARFDPSFSAVDAQRTKIALQLESLPTLGSYVLLPLKNVTVKSAFSQPFQVKAHVTNGRLQSHVRKILPSSLGSGVLCGRSH